MKTPPFLLFATLLFWGWQSHLLVYGALAGAVLEAARVFKPRWDLEDVDFNRLWSLCVVVALATFGYIFTTNDEGGGMSGLTQGPMALRNATTSSSVAANTMFRWLPLIFFPFLAAQIYNVRPTVPLTSVSMALRIRRRRGEKALAGRYVDIAWAYFMVCILSAGLHASQGTYLGTYSYLCGQAVLILWALWVLRSRRFGLKVWAGALAVILVLGFFGLLGINEFARLVQRLDVRIITFFTHSRIDPSQSMTAIGQIGELKLSPRIVIRLEPREVGMAPSYLREASYCKYGPYNQSWFARTNFSPVQAEADNKTWLLVPAKKAVNTVNIACYLEGRSEGAPEGVLPLPSGACRLENLPANSFTTVQTNETGVVLATGPGLMIFDARFGPGATMDAPPNFGTSGYSDLSVPTNEIPALQQVLAEMSLTNCSDAASRQVIQAFFAQKFTYSMWQRPTGRSTNTPLTRFLLYRRSGHCEFFATATVLLLRQLGIPARYAVGYAVHETAGTGFVVRERDAHAWCLVWNRQTGIWEDFDTTPASWIAIEGRNASLLDALSDLRSWLVFQFEKFRWRQTDLRPYFIWTISPVIVVLLYYIFFQRRAKARAAAKKVAAEAPILWPGHDSAFYRLEQSLTARGLPRQPQEPLADWLERALAEPALASLRQPLRELLFLHYRYRFDPPGLAAAEKKLLAQNVETILAALAQVKATSASAGVRP